ncbi:MAG: PQQ-dependent dehydrogenase, methanol/ethanol family [Novosphingobium sp.]|nr:PQQ-dependent dehydrogenase, methanol/ethanol family [Novosphingobium sp.]
MTLIRRLILTGLGLLCLASCSMSGEDDGVGTGDDWLNTGGGYDESGYSRLDQIDTGNIGELGLAWSLDLEGEQTLEATPLAVDGVLYFTGSLSKVYAVDGASGAVLWTHDPEVWKHDPERMNYIFGANRGAAYADGRVFVGTLDGRLLGLDAATGRLEWSADTLPDDSFYTSTGAPRVFAGKVIIGNGGGDFGERGYVTAYDQKGGKQLWRFYTVPGSPEQNKGDAAMEMAAETWNGEYWKTGTGGTVWNGMTYDPELGQIYLGTGNSGPYDPEVRSPGGGDNLFLASIVALDAETGKYIWHYQVNPREAWDYKATMNMIAGTLEIDGKSRKVLMQAPTNGFFYVLDRETGKLISAEKTGKVTWAERIDLETGRPVEAPNIRYETGRSVLWPSMMGTHNWQAMSFSPKTGLVYIPYMQLGIFYEKNQAESAASYAALSFGAVREDEEDNKGALLAWDPVAQEARWKVPHDLFWNGGTLATAGNLVFQGTADGTFAAYDAENGKPLWRFDAGHGIIAAPMSFTSGGKQYVSVLVGYGGAWGEVVNAGWKYGAQPRRLLTFAIGGTAKLPQGLPRDMKVHALDDPALVLAPEDIAAGEIGFMTNCAGCHGKNLVATGSTGPDLRETPLALQFDDFWRTVHDGALAERGMPRFDALTKEQARQIHAYIRAGARAVLRGEDQTGQAPSGGRN